MDLSQFITDSAKGPIALADLTTLAADRRCFGDDALAAFTSQVQLRTTAAQVVLDAATAASRDTLLASEQRSYDSSIRERDSILGLLRQIEQRTETRSYVPPTQTITPSSSALDELATVLSKEQRCSDWVKGKGARYIGERGSEAMRFGRVVRAFALGDKRGLSDLELRALAEGSDSAGGFTVPEILSGTFIDRVRNAAVVFQAGAQTVPMTSDTLHIARLAQPGVSFGSPAVAAAPLSWKVENNPIAESDLTLERVTFTARTLPLLIKMSVELSEDSNNIDAIIEREFSQAIALELDRVALVGSGIAPEPSGLLTQSGVDVAPMSSADYDGLIDAVADVASRNHTANARVYSSVFARDLAKLRGVVNGDYLRPPAYLDSVREFVTNAIDIGSPNGGFIVGDFTQLMIGIRTSFRLEVSRVAGDAFQNLQVWIRAYVRSDAQLAHPEAFAVRT
jgi:HK97 family phage major capsid protein